MTKVLTRERAEKMGMRPRTLVRTTRLEFRALGDGEALPDGVCGIVQGVALVYNEVDDYGTRFAPGCLSKSRDAKVPARKLNTFADHDKRTKTHVGLVTSLDDVANDVVMIAPIFDTEDGRRHKQYLEAVIAAGGEIGLSIGFRPRAGKWVADTALDGGGCYEFTEIELREISYTPCAAVPGAAVTGVRKTDMPGTGAVDEEGEGEGEEDGVDDPALLALTLRSILSELPEADARRVFDEVYPAGTAANAEAGDTASGDGSTPANDPNARSEEDGGGADMAYRIKRLRESFAGA